MEQIKHPATEHLNLKHFKRDIGNSYLSHGIGQDLNDFFVRCRNHTLAVDLDDTVADAYASSLSDTSPHQAADLQHTQEVKTQGSGLKYRFKLIFINY